MSLLLNKPSKLCLGKPALIRSSHFLSNGFSSSSLQFPPFSINGCGIVIRRNVTKGRHTCLAKKVPVDEDEYEIIWPAYPGVLATFNHDGVLGFYDSTSTLESEYPKQFSSPPFVTLPRCQTQIITNVVASSPLDDEDCVVAVKFLGPQLSFFRPALGNSSGWTNVRIENPCFYSSEVMFSKKDGMFRIPGSGGHLIGSWDLHTHKQTPPKIQRLRLRNLPERTKTQRELLESCCTSVFLVESQSTDETFLVKWFKKTLGKIMRTKGVMVFRLDHKGNAIYTQDIGDLFIFLSRHGISCEPAAEAIPCLKHRPNYVRVLDDDWFFSIDLASGGLEVCRRE
ncbi:uncharacterized protein LOC110229995 [Arabidopsis lyrata subsp. lyrata]|uniref:uncharacterized protein LOC110229995 n=1 Tax=Arabidopsis lyrata subsp. lyrata TaxID=81972 RepID=UPI000A29BDDD|nr:uncharacterized protein LOC110229995 [Arabidopsis lyrata subsp. lyrata]|eukprot:XP_020887090.1 uncharacterized protein LOC110229995 [Arabidopsis lyrata subsp. lyrata]